MLYDIYPCCLFIFYVSSVQSFSSVWLFATSWTAAFPASLSFTNFRSLLKLVSLIWWCHPTISSSDIPFSSHPPSFPASGSFLVSFSLQVAKVVEFQLRHQSFQWIFRTDFLSDGLVGFLAIQGTLKKESSPTPQFKSINSSALSFLYSPTLPTIHDHWKNHSLD